MAKVGSFFKEEEEKNGTPDVESQSCKHLCEGVCSAKHHRQIGTACSAVSKTSPRALTCINYACRKRSRVKTTGGGRRGVSEEGSD